MVPVVGFNELICPIAQEDFIAMKASYHTFSFFVFKISEIKFFFRQFKTPAMGFKALCLIIDCC
jgi:hypothetical protein